jgi:hypothetical protein
MKRSGAVLAGVGLIVALVGAAPADEAGKSPIPKMSKEQLVKLAMSAAPPAISKDATILVPGADGKMVEAQKGTNGFTCLPDIDGQEKPDPICADAAAWQWVNDLMAGAPKPTNAVPGVAYMAQGGWHWQKDGKIVMKPEPGAVRHSEPGHWMIFWPFDAKATRLPALPTQTFGTHVMWDGTPYAHLMIYQDPTGIK